MGIIGIFLFLFVGVMAVGFAVAADEEQDRKSDDKSEEEPPRVVVMQEVPDPFAAFQRKKK